MDKNTTQRHILFVFNHVNRPTALPTQPGLDQLPSMNGYLRLKQPLVCVTSWIKIIIYELSCSQIYLEQLSGCFRTQRHILSYLNFNLEISSHCVLDFFVVNVISDGVTIGIGTLSISCYVTRMPKTSLLMMKCLTS